MLYVLESKESLPCKINTLHLGLTNPHGSCYCGWSENAVPKDSLNSFQSQLIMVMPHFLTANALKRMQQSVQLCGTNSSQPSGDKMRLLNVRCALSTCCYTFITVFSGISVWQAFHIMSIQWYWMYKILFVQINNDHGVVLIGLIGSFVSCTFQFWLQGKPQRY